MNTIVFILIMYYIISGLIAVGRTTGEKWKWYEVLFSFLFGFVLIPILIGVVIKKHI